CTAWPESRRCFSDATRQTLTRSGLTVRRPACVGTWRVALPRPSRGWAPPDPFWLDRAQTCLRWDLARCVALPSGGWYVREGSRHLPYLDTGSLGLGVLAARYLRH